MLKVDDTDREKYTNEVGVCIPMLEQIGEIRGKVITTDAMLATRGIAQHLLSQQAHYLFTIKNNQPHLCEAIGFHFESLFRTRAEVPPDFTSTTGDESTSRRSAPKIRHGRKETRRIRATDALNDYLADTFNFPGVGQAFLIERHVEQYRRDRQSKTLRRVGESRERCIGITSLGPGQADAPTLPALNRNHWTVEAVHRILDEPRNRNEDKCRIRKGFGPENMTALRRLAIAIMQRFRRHGESVSQILRELRDDTRRLLDYMRMTRNTRPGLVCRE